MTQNMDLPGNPSARRARRDSLTSFFARMLQGVEVVEGEAIDFLSYVFRRVGKKAQDSNTTAEEHCSKLRAFFDQRPRPWRGWRGYKLGRAKRKAAQVRAARQFQTRRGT